MKNKFRYICSCALAAIVMSSCGTSGSGNTPAATTTSSNVAVIACDASFENIIQQEIDVFEYINPKYSILPYYIDESACIDSLMDGRSRLAVISRPLTTVETNYIKTKKKVDPHTTRIAVDAIALIVNKDNPINVLTVSEISDILKGKYETWRDLEPSKLGKISVVFDHQGSSTVRYMRDSLLNGEPFGDNVFAQGNNPAVFETVKNNKNAIGVIGVSWISTDMNTADMSAAERAANLEQSDTTTISFRDDVKVLRVRRDDCLDSYKPYQAYIFDGSYPLYRSMYMVNAGVTGTAPHSFYVFVTGWRGQKVIQTTGVLPGTVRPRMVNLE